MRHTGDNTRQILRTLDLLGVIPTYGKGEARCLLLICEIHDDQAKCGSKLPGKCQQPLRIEVRVVVVEVMQTIGKLCSTAPYFRQLANQTDYRLTVRVVEIVPAHRPIKHYPPIAAVGNPIVLAELLPLRQQRRSLAGEQRNQIGLDPGPFAVTVALLQQYVAWNVIDGHVAKVTNETLMIVILKILQGGLGQSVASRGDRRR